MHMLPPAEYRLFLAVAGGRGKTVRMRVLFRVVWPRGASESALRRLVYRLRRRIGSKYVESIRGIGYRLVDA
jgi:DNA-binding response OmpR family regulator